MPTNLALDDALIEKARAVGGHRTKKDAVNAALEAYVRRYQQREIIDLFGTVAMEPGYDYKTERARKRAKGR